ncbi:MAG: type II toxin-antitoxin system RelE/ParE family toxin [Chlorobium sp.]
MNFEFLPEADEEFREASRYYENETPGVGLAFIAEVHRVISMVICHPLATKKTRGTIRSKVLLHFPYSLFYSIESDLILIVAVAHQKRRPTYWRSRLKRME